MDCEFTSEELIKKVEKRKQLEEEQRHIGWYFWLLSEYPALVIGLCVVLITAFAVVGVLCTTLPDFSEPSKGFEVRGTPLANKLVAWNKLVNETGYGLTLSNYPYAYFERKANTEKIEKKKHGRRSRSKRSLSTPPSQLLTNSFRTWDFKVDGYFCDNPKTKYANWIFELKDGQLASLWSAEGLLSICRNQKQLLKHIKYQDVCIRQSLETCCPVMSLPNYVAYIAGLRACENITQHSINQVERTLRTCEPYYCQESLKSNCWLSQTKDDNCPEVPKKCTKYNAVYSIFHYFFEQSIVCSLPRNIVLKRTAVFLPAHKHRNLLPIYYDNFEHPKSVDVVRISAIDFGLKEFVFEQMLFADTQYPLYAMAAVGIVIFLYTQSFFITLMNFISTVSAMLMSYFFYTIVLDFKYFPFINLAALLVMVGISADNVLVFFSAWKNYAAEDERVLSQAVKGKPHPLPLRTGIVLKITMKHVAWSLFVTGLTTAAAFLANFSSQVTAIKCFGVYTGLTVLTNLFLSLTWLPATIVFNHKYINCSVCNYILNGFKWFIYWAKFKLFLSEAARVFFDKIQVLIIVRLRYIWALIFMLLAIGSVYIVVVEPGLHLPATKTYFQYFKSSHLFETYTSNFSQDFAFQNQSSEHLPVRIVFGIWPTDMGDSRDPDNTGTLQFQRKFNASSRPSQEWLLNFCRTMRNTSYFRPMDDQQQSYTFCFIEAFKEWMESKECTALEPVCCKERRFPYRPVVFNRCLKEAISLLNINPLGIRLHSWTAGPRFNYKDTIRSVIVEFSSNVKYTASYETISQFYKEMNDFLRPRLNSAPKGLADGWFVSDLEFFALQKGLFDGTVASVGWSILVALLVILITSRNLLISIFASTTIAGIIFVTVASLVLMGWELNVLESVTISIAVGLSVDFTAHYAIAYIVATPKDDRQRRVEFSASKMGPPITLAALTTFLAGVGMIPAHVLAYTQFGVFLVLIMVASWLYSSYFFLAVLSIMGPQGRCCDLCCCCDCDTSLDSDEHTTTIFTESSVCTPSTSYHNDRSTAI